MMNFKERASHAAAASCPFSLMDGIQNFFSTLSLTSLHFLTVDMKWWLNNNESFKVKYKKLAAHEVTDFQEGESAEDF